MGASVDLRGTFDLVAKICQLILNLHQKYFVSKEKYLLLAQGGRTCAKAQKAIAEKSGVRRKILSHNICYFVAIFTAFMVTVEKIITNALGEHDPGSAQNWRTSREMWSPA